MGNREPYLENTSLFSPKEGHDGFALFFSTQEQRLIKKKKERKPAAISSQVYWDTFL